MFFKVKAMGDTIYIEAKDRADAERQFRFSYGGMPAHLLTWEQIDALPEGEEAIYIPE